MKKNKKVVILIICILAIVIVAINVKFGGNTQKDNIGKTKNVDMVFKQLGDDVNNAKSGKYANIKIKNLNIDVKNTEDLYQINIIPNYDYTKNTYKENVEAVKSVINTFYGENINTDAAMVYIPAANEDEDMTEYSFQDFQKLVDEDKIRGDGYFLVFKDNRENGEKGFLQIDPSLVSIWLSKGELESTSPMYGYNTKKVYNFTLNENVSEDKVMLKDGEITIEEAKNFIENYLNNSLPYKKNDDFIYEVAEIRILDADGQDAIGACVRKKYNEIPFDYIDGTTEGIYNSDFWDDRGELCMAKTNEIDNICGLGGDTYFIEKYGKKIKKMYSFDDALKTVSDSIGENSVYDIYGAEIIYQFTPVNKKDDDGEVSKYKGRLQWKIVARNENDDKDTWFYVDIETGKLSHRFKKIYGE
ncbi:MAG: hypothetical protein MR361_04105 [Clostridiales bacterium]|nr:hypothetical protein [Clostridiales bacterium]MDD6292420.1 hypothetical protein [Eubacteriales bacterium]